MSIFGVFDNNLNYTNIPKPVVNMIKEQQQAKENLGFKQGAELYHEDVELIAKNGKLYYLPHEGSRLPL